MDFPMWFLQTLRGFCILVGPFTIFVCFALLFSKNIAKHRKWTFAGIMLLTMGSIYTRITHWGEPANVSLFTDTPGVLCIAIGLRTMRSHKTRNV